MAVSFWLVRTHRNALFTALPMAFMLTTTAWSLILHIIPFTRPSFHREGAPWTPVITSGTGNHPSRIDDPSGRRGGVQAFF